MRLLRRKPPMQNGRIVFNYYDIFAQLTSCTKVTGVILDDRTQRGTLEHHLLVLYSMLVVCGLLIDFLDLSLVILSPGNYECVLDPIFAKGWNEDAIMHTVINAHLRFLDSSAIVAVLIQGTGKRCRRYFQNYEVLNVKKEMELVRKVELSTTVLWFVAFAGSYLSDAFVTKRYTRLFFEAALKYERDLYLTIALSLLKTWLLICTYGIMFWLPACCLALTISLYLKLDAVLEEWKESSEDLKIGTIHETYSRIELLVEQMNNMFSCVFSLTVGSFVSMAMLLLFILTFHSKTWHSHFIAIKGTAVIFVILFLLFFIMAMLNLKGRSFYRYFLTLVPDVRIPREEILLQHLLMKSKKQFGLKIFNKITITNYTIFQMCSLYVSTAAFFLQIKTLDVKS